MITRELTIGIANGSPRLWLEGLWLRDAGFPAGQPYQAFTNGLTLELRTVKAGESDPTVRTRVVSGKDRKGDRIPVIDINSGKVVPMTGTVSVVCAEPGRIVVTKV